MNIHLLVIKAFRRLRRVGFRAALGEALARLQHVRTVNDFDLKHSTDTGHPVPLWKLRIRSRNAHFGIKYEATDEHEFVAALTRLQLDFRTFAFLDLGCGKGKTLLLASQFNFEQIIGVEFARDLVEIAEENLKKLHVKNAVVVHGDAADFQFPNSDMVVYLYNPFTEEVMREVLSRLSRISTRNIYIIYKVPACAALFDSCRFLTRLGSSPENPSIHVWKSLACGAEGI